jgi:CubicO group peptidase (beta-lactamase class C family)
MLYKNLSFIRASVALLIFGIIFLSSPSFAQKVVISLKPVKGYGEASYSVAESEKYMSRWLVAGPIEIAGATPDETAQRDFFKQEMAPVNVLPGKLLPSITINNKVYPWETIKSTSEIVDLDSRYSGLDFVAAFALAEIKSDKAEKRFLGVGSDDAIRIWHNGKLIHDNWVPRAITKDEDLVPINLVQGSNQILVKVQDMTNDWGFVVRLLDQQAISEQLISASGRGDLDQIKNLFDAGANPNLVNSAGLNALNNAKLHGFSEVSKVLMERGAKESPMPSLEKLIDGIYNSINGKKAPGAAVLVSKDGKVLYKKGFGYADIDAKQLIQPQTKFRIGSITKQFTAAAILKLQEEGKISVNDKLSKFLPDFPRADEVTIHHLLTHTSGIHSYTAKPEFMAKVTSPVSEDELIAFFKNDPYDFNPGERWEYNNSAYFLLGHIISKVSGKSFENFLKDNFFAPLAMTNTGVHHASLKLTNEAKGYTKERDVYKLATNWDMSWAGGAGALYSTVEDLSKWNEGLYGGKVINEKSLQLGLTPVVLNNGEKASQSYGYGLMINNYRGQDVAEHGGGLHGFVSQLAWYPEEKLTVAILTNITPPEMNLNSNRIAEFLLWENMEPAKSKSTDLSVKEDVTPYLGRYDFQGGIMTITVEGGNLFAQLTRQPKFPIFPSAPGEYFWKVVDAKIKFVKNANGEVEYADFEQSGNKRKVAKLPEEKIVAIDKTFYKIYSGRYDMGNSFIITVSTENEKLFAQATNQPKFEIFPLSEKEFMLKEVNAKLIFITEPGGKPSKMILDQGGQRKDLVRLVD